MLPQYDICCKIFEENGLELTEKIYERLDIYADFLVKTNEVMNLAKEFGGEYVEWSTRVMRD